MTEHQWVISAAGTNIKRHHRTVHASANCSALHKRTNGSLRQHHSHVVPIPADLRWAFASCTLCIAQDHRWIAPLGPTPENVSAWWNEITSERPPT